MSLTGTTRPGVGLTRAERALEPRSLGVLAWFDGYGRGSNPNARPTDYPRRLDSHEARWWREGYDEGRRERICHVWHGFGPCDHEHPNRLPTDRDKAAT